MSQVRKRSTAGKGGSEVTKNSKTIQLSSWEQLRNRLTFVHLTNDAHFNFVCSWAAFLVCFCAVWESLSGTAYGRFGGDAVIALNPRIGWWMMELPVTLTFGYFFFIKGGSQSHMLVPRIMATIMCIHYSYRGWIFPYLIRVHGSSQNFSIVPALFGSLVTVTHGYLNAKWFAEFGTHLRDRKWLRHPCFLLGLVIYFGGLATLIYHDKIIRDLRASPGPRYKIPYGGFYEYVGSGGYTAELITWFGFFLLSFGPNGLFILTVSMANLIPRSIVTTAWYKEKFGDEYPADRKHIIPFIF